MSQCSECFLKDQIIKDVDFFFAKGIIDLGMNLKIIKAGDFQGSDLISSESGGFESTAN